MEDVTQQEDSDGFLKKNMIVKIGNKTINLITKPFGSELDMDNLTEIHHGNLLGEMLTIPTILNRVGLLKAEAQAEARKAKFTAEIYEAGFKRKLRKEASVNGNYFKIEGERIKLSEKSLEESALLDEQLQALKDERYDAEMYDEFLNSLYWALTEKSKKIDSITKGMKEDELEVTEDTINGVKIKLVNRN